MGKLKYYIKRAFEHFNTMEMRVLPGNVAFFFVLALIPMITTVVIVASYFSISIDTVIDFVYHLVPGEAGDLIVEVISGKGFDSSIGTFNAIALFVASNGTYAIINASNALYDVHNSDTLKDRIKAILLLLVLLLLLLWIKWISEIIPYIMGKFLCV